MFLRKEDTLNMFPLKEDMLSIFNKKELLSALNTSPSRNKLFTHLRKELAIKFKLPQSQWLPKALYFKLHLLPPLSSKDHLLFLNKFSLLLLLFNTPLKLCQLLFQDLFHPKLLLLSNNLRLFTNHNLQTLLLLLKHQLLPRPNSSTNPNSLLVSHNL